MHGAPSMGRLWDPELSGLAEIRDGMFASKDITLHEGQLPDVLNKATKKMFGSLMSDGYHSELPSEDDKSADGRGSVQESWFRQDLDTANVKRKAAEDDGDDVTTTGGATKKTRR